MLHSLGLHFKQGGWGMWPIVFWFVFVIAIIIERAMYLFKSSINKDAFLSNIQKCILAGDVGRAIKLCSTAQAPLAHRQGGPHEGQPARRRGAGRDGRIGPA